MSETIEQYRNQIAIARTEIKNLRQQLATLRHEHIKEIKLIKTALNGLHCGSCADTAIAQGRDEINNESEPSTSEANQIIYKPIGIIETAFQNKRGVPRQPTIMSKAKGTVVIDMTVFNNPEHALSGLEEFSHMWIIFHMHSLESCAVPAKVAPPRLGGERRGVFSTRSPHRPCPIGLSLVNIHSIEGNKIHFLGVDMVNGTPVLDIKPFIPQYDYPVSNDNICSMERPPTEGISDIADTMANLQVDDDGYDTSGLNPRLNNPTRIETGSSLPRSPLRDNLPSNEHSNVMTPVSPSPDSPLSEELLDVRVRSPLRRPDSERGAPDGQERFTPPQSAQRVNMPCDGIRVAPWITNPPSQAYEVRFTDDVVDRLNELIGERSQAFKSNIQSLLSEDPRSNYVRTRYPDHEYSCVLEDLSISCIFDSNSSICTIIAVRSAEDMQAA